MRFGAGIYVVQLGHLPFVKIGFSRHVASRICGMQQALPLPLRVLAVAAGDQKEEQRLHRKLKKWRSRGEWYAVDERFASRLRDLLPVVSKLPSSVLTERDLSVLRFLRDKSNAATARRVRRSRMQSVRHLENALVTERQRATALQVDFELKMWRIQKDLQKELEETRAKLFESRIESGTHYLTAASKMKEMNELLQNQQRLKR